MTNRIESLSLFALKYLSSAVDTVRWLGIFHYSPLIYLETGEVAKINVENLSLFAFDILGVKFPPSVIG